MAPARAEGWTWTPWCDEGALQRAAGEAAHSGEKMKHLAWVLAAVLGWTVGMAQDGKAAPGKGDAWEYKFVLAKQDKKGVWVVASVDGEDLAADPAVKLTAHANSLGEEGWEMVGYAVVNGIVMDRNQSSTNINLQRMVYKRHKG